MDGNKNRNRLIRYAEALQEKNPDNPEFNTTGTLLEKLNAMKDEEFMMTVEIGGDIDAGGEEV